MSEIQALEHKHCKLLHLEEKIDCPTYERKPTFIYKAGFTSSVQAKMSRQSRKKLW
jgi:hypothetical protein